MEQYQFEKAGFSECGGGAQEESHRSYILNNLDRALREGWIQVYYQPIIRAANGRVSDEEALARWVDPEKGILQPESFVPILEQAGLIYKMDLFILDQILNRMNNMKGRGIYVVPISLNLYRSEFDACDIIKEITERVDRAGISPSRLNIEITEHVISKDFRYMEGQIARLRDAGFPIWLDDFGKGSATLDVLQSIPFDLIKLDTRFMQQFQTGEKGRVILTEVVKMAIGLGIDTAAEGVETKSQASFLNEIGCTKQQGFYYCRPVSRQEIIERYEKGIQIGFENPEEREYYEALGRINLYDLSILANEDAESFRDYFDTLPMAIVEVDEKKITIHRCNPSFRDFINRTFGLKAMDDKIPLELSKDEVGSPFVNTVMKCVNEGRWAVFDEQLETGSVVHAYVRRVTVNPVTGVAACVVVILGIMKSSFENSGMTYAYVAEALSADYFSLYYVNLDTGQFMECKHDPEYSDLAVERHGMNFFERSYLDAKKQIYPGDLDFFREHFTKEKVMKSLEEQGSFTMTLRLMVKGEPVYVNMKAVRIAEKGNHIVIGISNVDAQMKQQEAMERVEEERTTYARITALSGDYIAIYTVNPSTDDFREYSASKEYDRLGLEKRGDDFFGRSREESLRIIYPEDESRFLTMFTKERIFEEIARSGVFRLDYRLMIDGEPCFVNLKAAIVQEKDGPQLIVGVSNVDSQVKRDQEYANRLSEARDMANLDALTGVKNKHAYVDMEAHLNKQIEDGKSMEFAVGVLDVNGLKQINDTMGHHAGDLYIQEACSMICNIFKHSPVFRVGGDEFAVLLQGTDYRNREALEQKLREQNLENKGAGRVVVACGIDEFREDRNLAAVFERADKRMYEEKRKLKEEAV